MVNVRIMSLLLLVCIYSVRGKKREGVEGYSHTHLSHMQLDGYVRESGQECVARGDMVNLLDA